MYLKAQPEARQLGLHSQYSLKVKVDVCTQLGYRI